jgi:hypothetical protein
MAVWPTMERFIAGHGGTVLVAFGVMITGRTTVNRVRHG